MVSDLMPRLAIGTLRLKLFKLGTLKVRLEVMFMSDFSRGAMLGLVGSVIILHSFILAFIHFLSASLLDLVGTALLLAGLHIRERSIFRNALLSIVVELGLSLTALIYFIVVVGVDTLRKLVQLGGV